MNFCFKHQYEVVKKDGFQYCKKCGLAVKPAKTICVHKWKKEEALERVTPDKRVVGVYFVLKCVHCGDMKNHKLTK